MTGANLEVVHDAQRLCCALELISAVVLNPHGALRVHHAAAQLLERHHWRVVDFFGECRVVVLLEEVAQVLLRERHKALAELDVLQMLLEEQTAKKGKQRPSQTLRSSANTRSYLTLKLQLFQTFSYAAARVECSRGHVAALDFLSNRPRRLSATWDRARPRFPCSSSSRDRGRSLSDRGDPATTHR